MSGRRSAMCLLCHEVRSVGAVSLFTARRGGEAGRNGNTVGTDVCADLDCAHRAQEVPPTARHLDPGLQELAVAERVEGLRRRLAAFTPTCCAAEPGGPR